MGPTSELLSSLGNPERHFSSLHVGGTNGKGSVATMLASVLGLAGHSVGLYTSPHLVDVRERMVVDGRPISRDAFCSWTVRMMSDIERTDASFFEATTAIAFADFAVRGVDVAVVEVGLGGRLDSTNVLVPLVSGVVCVGMDHTDYLGDSIEGIAREKAGIAKADVPFVVGERDPAIAAVLETAAREVGAPVHVLSGDVEYRSPIGMVGRHQRRNAAVAAKMLDVLPDSIALTQDQIARGIARAWVPGRFDRRGRWLFDVAHNPDAMAVLVRCIGQANLQRPIHAVVGMLRDKDASSALRILQQGVDAIWATVPPSAEPRRQQDLTAAAARANVRATIEPDFDRALEVAQDGAGTVVVTGSFHTVGDAMARLPGFAPLG